MCGLPVFTDHVIPSLVAIYWPSKYMIKPVSECLVAEKIS